MKHETLNYKWACGWFVSISVTIHLLNEFTTCQLNFHVPSYDI